MTGFNRTSFFGLLMGLSFVACDVGDNKLGDETQSGSGDGSGGDSSGGSDTDGSEESGAAETSPGTDGGGCEPGDQQPAGDGCNTCDCDENGNWLCTEIGCPACEDGDVTQNPDGCLCECVEGAFVCPDSCDGCTPGDEMPAGDGCNACVCDDNGNWGCSEIDCPPADGDPFDGPEVAVCDGSVPMDPLVVNGVTLEGDTLTVDVAYTGGCAMHLLGGCWDEQWAESFPVQTGLAIAHDDPNDPCDAFPSDQVVLDLTPIAEGYQAAYGAGPATVHINLAGWSETIVYTF
jgi:hypothetical protein